MIGKIPPIILRLWQGTALSLPLTGRTPRDGLSLCRAAVRTGLAPRPRLRPRSQAASRPRSCGRAGGGGLMAGLARSSGAHPLQAQSARAAASTSSAWPFTFTFGQTRAMRPSPSSRKVVREMPI